MKILTGIVAFYFLILAAANVYFVSMIQSGAALSAWIAGIVLVLERPVVWVLNWIPMFYMGNMRALSDVTMRSSVIMLCACFLLVICCALLIRVED